MRTTHIAVFGLAIAGLAACSGGGTGTTAVKPPVSLPSAGTASTVFSFVLPITRAPAGRHRAYVSAATKSITIAVTQGTLAPVTFTANVDTSTCATESSGFVCSYTAPIPTGTETIGVQLFSAQNAGGQLLATGSTTVTIVPNTANAVSVTLQAVLGGVSLTSSEQLVSGTIFANYPLTATYTDPSGAIIGPDQTFSAPATLVDSDTSGATTLIVNDLFGHTIRSSSDAITLNYNGAPLSTFTISVNGLATPSVSTFVLTQPSAPSGPIMISNTVIDTIASTDPNYNAATLNLSMSGSPQSVTVSQNGYSGPFTVVLDPVTCETGAWAVTSFTTTNNQTFTFTPVNPGLCKATVSEGSFSTTLWIANVALSIGVQ